MTGLACLRGHCANSDGSFSRAIQHAPEHVEEIACLLTVDQAGEGTIVAGHADTGVEHHSDQEASLTLPKSHSPHGHHTLVKGHPSISSAPDAHPGLGRHDWSYARR
jgi:hypothetical protein